jgi:CBS domain containing-hemolysin-like protein
MGNDLVNALAVAALIAANAFFVAAEYAMVRVRKTRLSELAQRGVMAAKPALLVVEHLDRYIATTQLGITMAGIGLGWVGEPVLSAFFGHVLGWPLQGADEAARRTLSAVCSFLLVTFITVVLGELVPKSFTIKYPERIVLAVSPIIVLLGAVFRPFIGLLNVSAEAVLRLVGLSSARASEPGYSVEELKMLVQTSEETGVLEDTERDMLHAVFDFGEATASEIMVPRTEIIASAAEGSLDELIQLSNKHPFSKFPVFEHDLDHVIGIAHVKDLVRVQHHERRAATVRGLMREALFVPDTLRLDALLQQFRAKRQHIAIVLDEFGGTAGLVTLDDLMAQIVGEVADQFDKSAPAIQTLPDGSALLDGLTAIETINETFRLNLTDDYYDTIAGFVLGRLGRMAKVGDVVDVGNIRLKVEALDGLRIARLSLYRADAAKPPSTPN